LNFSQDAGKADFGALGYARKTRQNMTDCHMVQIGRKAGAGVFGDDNLVAQFPSLARCRLDAEIGGNAGENNGLDAAPAKLEIQFRAAERAPLPLGDQDIAGLCKPSTSSLKFSGKPPDGMAIG
jgi:hypothetical protein